MQAAHELGYAYLEAASLPGGPSAHHSAAALGRAKGLPKVRANFTLPMRPASCC